MKNKPFLIRLTPAGAFFFGGEKNLAGTGNDNYFVRSSHFPQQTSLLGLLRMQLLATHGLLAEPHLGRAIPDPEKAKMLIGETGFWPGHESAYGQIAAIGPCLLARGDEFFAPMLYTSNFVFSEKAGRFASVLSDDAPREFVPHLSGFDPKNTPETRLFGSAGSPPIEMKDVFGEKIRVGITKNKKHFAWLYPDEKDEAHDEAEMEGFFKQVSLCFKNEADKKPWQFIFSVWLDEGAGKNMAEFSTQNPIVWLGAERSAFNFEILEMQELPDFAPAFPILEKDLMRVVLLSDAWVSPNEVYKNCLFAHTEGLEFRFLQSEVAKTKNYYQRGRDAKEDESLGRSPKHALLRRGSVFLCHESQFAGLQTALNQPKAFRRIGCNAFAAVRGDVQTHLFQPENQ